MNRKPSKANSGSKWIHCKIATQTHNCLHVIAALEDKQFSDKIAEILEDWTEKNKKSIAAMLTA